MKHPNLRICLILIVFITGLSNVVTGQTGSVKGIVHDEIGSLPAAAVGIQGTTIGTSADLEGNFIITGLEAGKYILYIQYLGYVTFEEEITIESGRVVDLGVITMQSEQNQLEEVVISARLQDGEAKAINITKVSENLINVLASQSIGKLPDNNAAEALRRVPAVNMISDQGEGRYISIRGTPRDWNATLINGNRLPAADEAGDSRSVALDFLPAELIQYIIVSKSLTPGIEADAIGGSANFITWPAAEKRTFSLSAAGGFNNQSRSGIYDVSLIYGDRTKNDKFGFILGASYFDRGYGTDNYELTYTNNAVHAVDRLELRDYTGRRTNSGWNFAAEYKFSERHKLQLKFIHGRFDDDELHRKTIYRYDSGTGSAVELQNIHNQLQTRFFSGEIGTSHQLGDKWNLDWQVASYSNKFQYGPLPNDVPGDQQGYYVTRFSVAPVDFIDRVWIDSDGDGDFEFYKLLGEDQVGAHPTDTFNTGTTYFTFPDTEVVLGAGDAPDNVQPILAQDVSIDDFEFVEAYTEYRENTERDPFVGQMNIRGKVNNRLEILGGLKGRLKQGSRIYDINIWKQNFDVTTQSIRLTEFAIDPLDSQGGFLQELGSPYETRLWSFLQPDELDNLLTTLGDRIYMPPEEDLPPSEIQSTASSNYSYEEKVFAGYISASYQLHPKWNISGGVRMEYTTVRSTAQDRYFNFNLLTFQYNEVKERLRSQTDYYSFFPSVQLKFEPRDNLNLRLAVSRSMRRPNFNETKPGQPIYDKTNAVFEQGNSELQPSYAWNVDLSAEYFFQKIGMTSISFYWKHIQDLIFTTNVGRSELGPGFIIRSFDNADISYLMGVEAQINRKFDFLPSFLDGFGVNVNYAYTFGEILLPGRTEAQPLLNQSDHIVNLALFYEKSGVTARLALNYKAPTLIEYNTSSNDPDPENPLYTHQNTDFDIFSKDQIVLDLSLQYKFKDHYAFFFNMNNLLNSPYKEFRGEEFRPVKVEYYSFRALLGFKFEL